MANKNLCKRTDGCTNDRMKKPGNTTLYFKGCQDCEIKATIPKVRKQIQIENSKIKKEKTIELLSSDGYRQKHVQPIINEIARLIDYNQPCIATGSFNGKMSGGHFWSVGSNRTTCLNLHNIHVQSFHSNSALGGDNIRYREGIIKTYGLTYMEQIEALRLLKPLKLSKEDLIDIKKVASEIRNDLKRNPKVLTPQERIALREEINQILGIYQ